MDRWPQGIWRQQKGQTGVRRKGLSVQSDPGQGRLQVGGFSGVERHLQRGPGEAHQGSTEVSFRGQADTGTSLLLCHGWGGLGVLSAGFGF